MIYWITLLVLVSVCLFIDSKTLHKHRWPKYIIVFLLCYFSAFRDGLGADYAQYIIRLSTVETNFFHFSWLDEPTFWLFAYIIENSSFSYVFYFAVMAIITIVPILVFFFYYNRSSINILLFIFLSGIGYIQTFNQIRQSGALAIFLIAFIFYNRFQDKKLKQWTFFLSLIFIATLFHKSALFLIFTPLLFEINLSKKILLIFILLISYFSYYIDLPLYRLLPYFENFLNFSVGDAKRETSTVFGVFTLLLCYIICKKDNFVQCKVDERIFNLGYLCVVLYNFSYSSIAFSRIACYFAPMLILTITLPVRNNKLYKIFIISIFFFLFIITLLTGDPLIVPNKILPFSALFD